MEDNIKRRCYDKRLNKDNYTYAQKRLGSVGMNDDIMKDTVHFLEKENRYLKKKVKSIGIMLGIVIRELENNGYNFSFPYKKTIPARFRDNRHETINRNNENASAPFRDNRRETINRNNENTLAPFRDNRHENINRNNENATVSPDYDPRLTERLVNEIRNSVEIPEVEDDLPF